MILTDKIEIKLSSRNIGYYNKLYTKDFVVGDTIFVHVRDLPKNSRIKIRVKCDGCDMEKQIPYSDYNRWGEKDFGDYWCKNCKSNSISKGCFKKYGLNNVFQLEKVKEKIKETNMKTYGCEFAMQNKDVQEKTKCTNKEKYGVEYQMQLEENKIKSRKTCKLKYGVETNMGDVNIFLKQLKSGLRIKKYKNTELYYQGSYEKDFLDRYYNSIIIKNGFSIKYNIKKCYHPDFFIPSLNLIIEIKSSYWLQKHKNICLQKENACKEQGYNYIMILDKNYKEFDDINQIFNH